MSKTRKISIILTLVILLAQSARIIDRWPSQANAAGRPQELQSEALFFVSGPQINIQHLSTSEPELTLSSNKVLSSDTNPSIGPRCEVFGLHKSPNDRWIAVETGCEARAYTQLLEVATGQQRAAEPESWHDSYFLNWTPDGETYLIRVDPIGENRILLVNAKDGSFEQLDTPPYTYDAALSPDGKRILYAVSRGLGFGSEVWLLDRDGQTREQIINAPAHIIAYPTWSPSGDALAYIRMPDSNVPFTVGELLLADGDGRNARLLAPADAGHGYPPQWSPDGQQIAFVVRENPEQGAADISAPYLESNIYSASAVTGDVRALTKFTGALTDGPTWSPDGAWLAFSSDANGIADIWLLEIASGNVQTVTQNVGAHCPVWVSSHP